METKIHIADAGMFALAVHDEGELRVEESGGCPVDELLTGIDFDGEMDSVADEVLTAWMDGYDGDPHEAGLYVTVTREGQSVSASA